MTLSFALCILGRRALGTAAHNTALRYPGGRLGGALLFCLFDRFVFKHFLFPTGGLLVLLPDSPSHGKSRGACGQAFCRCDPCTWLGGKWHQCGTAKIPGSWGVVCDRGPCGFAGKIK